MLVLSRSLESKRRPQQSSTFAPASPAPACRLGPQQKADGLLRPTPAQPWQSRLRPTLDAQTHSCLRAGNRAKLVNNGEAGWVERLRLLQGADAVLLRVYELCDDRFGRALVAALRQKARQGCKVVVLFDFKGTKGVPNYAWDKLLPDVLAPLALSDNTVLVPCHVPRGFARLLLPCDHKKFFITLRRGQPAEMLMGGMNMGARYLRGGRRSRPGEKDIHGFRDTDLLVSGPVVGDAVAHFMADVRRRAPTLCDDVRRTLGDVPRRASYAPFPRGGAARLVVNDPPKGQAGRNIARLFERYCEAVPPGDTIIISNGYFLPLANITQAIVCATRRGVRFEILCNGPRSHDLFGKLTSFAGASLLRSLFERCPPGRLKVWFWDADPRRNLCAMHQKIGLFGRRGPVLVGSANLDAVSERGNFESAIAIDDSKVRTAFLDAFAADLRRPNVRRVRRADLQQTPFYTRALQWLWRYSLGTQL